LQSVKGVGPNLGAALAAKGLTTVKDVLLFIPLRYDDRSVKKKIADLQPNELVTVEVEITSSSNFYKGRRSIQSASVKDDTGKLKLMWFNNPHIAKNLIKGKKFLISGKLGDRGVMVQPILETLTEDSIHTGRLVPIYSMIPDVPAATFRRILKEIIDHLADVSDWQSQLKTTSPSLLPLHTALQQIHFPSETDTVIQARERLALEELLALIQHSQQLKEEWQKLGQAHQILSEVNVAQTYQLPFTLTKAQHRCIGEILSDLEKSVPMNRLLIGDVGSGKTAVAGIVCSEVIRQGNSAVLVAPTQILAEQHMATFQKLFPNLPTQMISAKTKIPITEIAKAPTVYIGTHALFGYLETIQPALLIYDEQHRFGVKQRSLSQNLAKPPHLLTLSATPIPRTLMLTLFSHLQLSVIDEMPAGRLPIKTWLVPASKRSDSLNWIAETISPNSQALVVCPFIDPSESEGLDQVAAATQVFSQLTTFYKKTKLKLALLHGRLAKKAQSEITTQLYQREIDLLVTTPIVEVGVDLPAANVIVIEAAERFGLASLHQLRGRVGRAGQQAYCLLFTTSHSAEISSRLKKFCDIHDGLKLAELDLQRRGAGDLFGTQQHGLDQLQFAEWTNLNLVTMAKQVSDQLQAEHVVWRPFIELKTRLEADEIPLAN